MADDLDSILYGSAAVAAPATKGQKDKRIAAVDPSQDDLDSILNDPAPTVQLDASADGIDEPVPGWTNSMKSVTDRLQLGMGSLTKGTAGLRLIGPDSEVTLDDVRSQFETQELIRAQTDTDTYIKTHGYWGMASNIPGWALEQLPVSGLGLAGAVGGVAVGAAIGAPLVGAGLVGGGLVVGSIMAGNLAYDLMERGVDRNTARWGGVLSGAVGGALEMLGFKGVAKGGEIALQASLKSKVFREQMVKLVEGLARGTAAEVGTEGAQSISDSVIKGLATRLDDKTKNDFTLEEAQSDFLDSVIRAAVVAPQLAGSSVVIGRLLGERARIAEEDIANAEAKNAANATPKPVQQPAKADPNKVGRQQVAAKKTLRGFVEVRQSQSLDDARQAVKVAQADLAAAKSSNKDTTYLSADLDYAKAELKAAELENAMTQLEDTLTDPNVDAELRTKLEARKDRLEKQITSAITNAAQAQLNKRMTKRAKQIETLRGEIRADKEAARENGGGADTAEMRDALQELRDQQELDQMVSDLFEEGVVTPDDVRFLKPQVSAKRLQGFLTLATKQLDLAAKDGAAAQKQKTQAVRKLLGKVIDNSRLPDSDKLSLMKKLELADSFDKLSKELPRIVDVIDTKLAERRRQAAEAVATKLVGSVKAIKSAPSKFPTTEEKLLAIRDFYNNPDASAIFEQELETKLANGEAPTLLDDVKVDLLAMFPPQDQTYPQRLKDAKDRKAQYQALSKDLYYGPDERKAFESEVKFESARIRRIQDEHRMPIETLDKIIDAVIQLKADGKAEALRRSDEIAVRQSRNESRFWAAATVREDGKQISKEEKASKIERALNDATSPHATWNTLMTILTQKGEATALTDVFNPKKANSKTFDMYLNWTGKLENALTARGIDREKFAKLNKEFEQDAGIPTYSRPVQDANGNTVLVQEPIRHPDTGDSLTLWEMVDFRNMLLDKDPDAVGRFQEGNKFTYPGQVPAGQSTLEVLEDTLLRASPDALKLADAYRDIYSDFHSVVDDAAFARWGRHIEFNPTYGGALASDSTMTGQAEMFRRITLRPRSLLARQGSAKRVMPRNAHDKMLEHLWQYSREAAWRNYEKDMPALFGNQQVRDFIIGNYGKRTYKVLTKYVEDMLKGGYAVASEMSKEWGWMRKRAFTYFLGGKPEQYWKQLTSVVYGLQYVSAQEMFDGHADFAADPNRAIERMNQSPLLRARGWLLNPTDLDASMRFRKSKLDELGEATMKAVERGDIHGVYLSSYPALVAELRKSGSMEKAIERFEQVFESLNSSGSIDELPAMFRGNIFERMITLFAQQPVAQSGLILQQILKARAGGKGAAKQLATTMAVAWGGAFAYNLVGYALMRPFMFDPDEADKRFRGILALAPLGPYAQIPIYGQALSVAWLQFLNVTFDAKLSVFTPEFLLTDTVNSVLKAANNAFKTAANPNDPENIDRALWSSVEAAGRLSGIPLTNILRPVRGITK
jgi:hypothetical protein